MNQWWMDHGQMKNKWWMKQGLTKDGPMMDRPWTNKGQVMDETRIDKGWTNDGWTMDRWRTSDGWNEALKRTDQWWMDHGHMNRWIKNKKVLDCFRLVPQLAINIQKGLLSLPIKRQFLHREKWGRQHWHTSSHLLPPHAEDTAADVDANSWMLCHNFWKTVAIRCDLHQSQSHCTQHQWTSRLQHSLLHHKVQLGLVGGHAEWL